MRSLPARLMLALAALLLPAAGLLLTLTVRSARAYYQEVTQRQNADVASNLVSEHDLMIGHDVDRAKLADLAKSLAMTNPGLEIYVIDPDGRLLAGSVPQGDWLVPVVDIRPVRAFTGDARRFPLLGTDPRRPWRTVFSAAPLAGGGGYLYAVLTDEMQASIVRGVQGSTALRAAIYGSLTILAVVLLAGAIAFMMLTRRLRGLSDWVAAFRRSGLDRGAVALATVEHPRDEIDELQNGFALLAARIGEQVDALRRADQMRRELVTNVSHDLRTPLAALRGSLETLSLKAETLSADEREAFLSTAQAQSERLGRLIDQLFELSLLDGEAAPGESEDFPLQELVHDALQKERPRAEAAGVRLELDVPEGLPFVRGNLGLLERALSNLIDNALRYTPAGGEVRVALRAQGAERVRVSVRDTGEGIAPEHAERVFERFYQVPTLKRRHGGAGLGLAISRRIVELHGGVLTLDSEVGRGSCFAFDLPVAPPPPVPVAS